MKWDLQERWPIEFLFVDGGNIQEDAEPQEFFSNPKNPRLKEFLSKVL